MIKKIFNTAGTKITYVLLNFLITIIAAKFLLEDNLAIIYLFSFSVTITQLISDTVSGSPTTYFTPKIKPWQIYIPGITWTFCSIIINFSLFRILSLFPRAYNACVPGNLEKEILICATLLSLCNLNYNFLLGQKKIKKYNLSFLIQIISLISLFAFFIFVLKIKNYYAYVFAFFLSYTITLLLTSAWCLPQLFKNKIKKPYKYMQEMLMYGWKTQLTNLIFLGNKKISLPIINDKLGKGPVAFLGAGNQIIEGLRIISQSIALIQYSEIINCNDSEKNKRITLSFIKIATVITLFGIFVLMLIPTSIYVWLLNDNFIEIKSVILSLSPGMLFFPTKVLLDHYFSGINKLKYNIIGTSIGFVIVIPMIYFLIPIFGFIGANLAVSFASLANAIFLFAIFYRMHKPKLIDIFPNKNDISLIKKKIADFKVKMKRK
ncbi:MAG: lipopolysaccharide biosynthesis protein [Bacteroidales bacterium]